MLSAEAPISEPVISDGTGYRLLQEEVRTAFECTIVDLPRSLLIYHPELAAQTHHIVLVAELTLAAARDVFRLAAWLKGAAPQTQISVALNKVPAGSAAEITKKDFETAIERKVDFIIPDDAKSARHAAKLGKALTDSGKGTRMGVAIADMAARLIAQTTHAGDDSPSETPAKASLVSRLAELTLKLPKTGKAAHASAQA